MGDSSGDGGVGDSGGGVRRLHPPWLHPIVVLYDHLKLMRGIQNRRTTLHEGKGVGDAPHEQCDATTVRGALLCAADDDAGGRMRVREALQTREGYEIKNESSAVWARWH